MPSSPTATPGQRTEAVPRLRTAPSSAPSGRRTLSATHLPSPPLVRSASALTGMSGTLLKRRDHFSGWRLRFFALDEGSRKLLYFLDEQTVTARGTARISPDLQTAELPTNIAPKTSAKYNGAFFPFVVRDIRTKKSWTLAAPSAGLRAQWVQALQRVAAGGPLDSTSVTGSGGLLSASGDSDSDSEMGSRQSAAGTPPGDALDEQQATQPAKLVRAPAPRVPYPDGPDGQAIAAAVQRLQRMSNSPDGWNDSGESNGVHCWRAKEGAGARGKGVTSYGRAAIKDVLVGIQNKSLTDKNFDRGHTVHSWDEFSKVTYFLYKAVAFTDARDFCNVTHWRVDPPEQGGSMYIVAYSVAHPECPELPGKVRAHCEIGGWVIRPRRARAMLAAGKTPSVDDDLDADGCDVTYLVRTDLKGWLPGSVVKSVTAAQAMCVQAMNEALDNKWGARGGPTAAAQALPNIYTSVRQAMGLPEMVPEGSAAAQGTGSGSTSPGAKPAREPTPPAASPVAASAARAADEAGSAGGAAVAARAPGPGATPKSLPNLDPANPHRVPRAQGGPYIGAFIATLLAAALSVAAIWLHGSWMPLLFRYLRVDSPDVRPQHVVLAIVVSVTLQLAVGLQLCMGHIPKRFNTTRRRLMAASWDSALGASVHGTLRIDVTKLQAYLEEKRAAGQRMTITAAAVRAVALAMRAAPGINGHLLCGRFIPEPHVNVACLVATARDENDQAQATRGAPTSGKTTNDLAIARISHADTMSTTEVNDAISRAAQRLRTGRDKDFEASKGLIRLLPVPVLRGLVHFMGWLAAPLGCSIGCIGVRRRPFGTAMVTSLGPLGLDAVHTPFTPFAHVPLLASIGKVNDEPVVVDGKVEIRPILQVCATLDHRFADGADAAVLCKVVTATLENPELLDQQYAVLEGST